MSGVTTTTTTPTTSSPVVTSVDRVSDTEITLAPTPQTTAEPQTQQVVATVPSIERMGTSLLAPYNLQRRTAESSRLFCENLHLVIEELRQSLTNNNPTTSATTEHVRNPTTPGANNSNNDFVAIQVEHINPLNPVPAAPNENEATIHGSLPESFNVPETATVSTNNGNNENTSPSSEIFRQSPEARAVLEVYQKYTPFILILLMKAVYDHRESLTMILVLFIAFHQANSVVRREVCKQARRSIASLLLYMVYLVGCKMFIDYVFNEDPLYISMILGATSNALYTQPMSVWRLLWIVTVVDYLVKLTTVFIKIIVALLPPIVCSYKKRGKIYLLIEALSQLYRSFLPIQPWSWFLINSYQGAERVMGVLLVAAYMVIKGTDLASRFKLVKNAFVKLIENVNVGSAATKEQLQTSGEQCPICHDSFQGPIALQPCCHVFCESCVSAWLDREPTCPLCRALVSDDPSWRDGSTTHFIQIY